MGESLNKNQTDSEVLLSEGTAGILWLIFLLYLFILGWITQYYEQGSSKNYFDILIRYIPEIMGSGTGAGIIPFIIAIVRKIRKKKPTKGIFIIYFIISTFIFSAHLFMVIKSHSIENVNSDLHKKFESYYYHVLAYDPLGELDEQYNFHKKN